MIELKMAEEPTLQQVGMLALLGVTIGVVERVALLIWSQLGLARAGER